MYHGKPTWLVCEVADLIDWVEDISGQTLIANLRRAASVLSGLLARCEKAGLDLFEVARLFGQLKTAYERHWASEQAGFLSIVARGVPRAPSQAYLTVWQATLAEEHRDLLTLLEALRQATFDYTLAPDALDDVGIRRSVEVLYALLRDIELDIHRHVHGVEERLFPQLRGGE